MKKMYKRFKKFKVIFIFLLLNLKHIILNVYFTKKTNKKLKRLIDAASEMQQKLYFCLNICTWAILERYELIRKLTHQIFNLKLLEKQLT